MRISATVLSVLAAMVLGAGAAQAQRPPDPGPTGGHKVHRLKPWKSDNLYLAQQRFRLRQDPSLDAPRANGIILKGAWLPIGCQVSAGGQLWDHIADGFVPDSVLKTYTDGRLAGSPACTLPHPSRVYAPQAWAKGSFYRVQVTQVTQRKPNLLHGTGDLRHKGDWIHIRCQTTGVSAHGSRLWDRLASGAYFPDADIKTYYSGRIPGAPACPNHTKPPKKPVYMALGDSYSSGLGADFVLQPDGHSFDHSGKGYYKNLPYRSKQCDRSPEAYSRYLAGRTRQRVTSAPSTTFLACQGDTTKEVMRYQVPRVPRNTLVVTLTVMGNDMGFSDVLKACAGKGGCTEAVRSHFGAHNSILKKKIHKLDRVLTAIRQRAPHATIVLGGYPKLFDPPNFDLSACKLIVTSEQELLNKKGDALDNAIRGAAHRHRGVVFADPRPWFTNHGPCIDGGPGQWINAIDLVGHSTAAYPWSMHPNHAGHEIYSEVFAEAAPAVFR